MDAERRAEVRARLMSELDWPVTSGEVRGAAETLGEDEVVVAATRLPDEGTWLEIDELWDDLDPILEQVVHGEGDHGG